MTPQETDPDLPVSVPASTNLPLYFSQHFKKTLNGQSLFLLVIKA